MREKAKAAGLGSDGGTGEGTNDPQGSPQSSPQPVRPSTVNWYGDGTLMLSTFDAIRAHQYEADAFPTCATPLMSFELWSDAFLVAQAWAIPDIPHLPSIRWWENIHYAPDDELAGTIERVANLVRGEPPLLDLQWRDCWRKNLLPPLLGMAEKRQRRRLRRSSVPYEDLDLVPEFERLTGGPGRRQGREIIFRCPFHDDRTPSLSVNVAKNRWYCFGCQRGGGPGALRRELES